MIGSVVEPKLLKFSIVSQDKSKHQKEVTSSDNGNQLENTHHLVANALKREHPKTDKIQVVIV